MDPKKPNLAFRSGRSWKCSIISMTAKTSVCEICSNALQAGKGKMSEYVSILSQYFNLLPKIKSER